jgi:hypothetical protein
MDWIEMPLPGKVLVAARELTPDQRAAARPMPGQPGKVLVDLDVAKTLWRQQFELEAIKRG